MTLFRRVQRLEVVSKRQGEQHKPMFGEWLADLTGEPEHRQHRTMHEFAKANPEEQQ